MFVRKAMQAREDIEIASWRTELGIAMVRYGFWAWARVLILAAITAGLLQAGSVSQRVSSTPQAQAAFQRGTADLKNGDFQGAVKAFQEFLTTDNNFGPAYLNLGLAYHSLKQYAKAIPSFNEALKLDSNLESASLFLGIDYCLTAAPEKAIGPLRRALQLNPNDPDGHLWLGRALLANGLYQEAIPQLRKASKTYPRDLALQYDLAQAHLVLSEQITDRIYRQNPHSYWAYFLRGQAYQVEGKVDLAIVEFKQAIRLDPSLQNAHEFLGELYKEKHDFDNAELEFHKELEVNPYSYSTVCKLTDILIQTGKVGAAIPILEKTSAARPSLGCARYELGRAWFRQDQIEKAVGNLEAAVALNPTYAPAYVLLGQSYAKLGKSAKAQAAFKKSRSLDEQQLKRIHENLIPPQQ